MLIPHTFTIGDDFLIRARYVTSGRSGVIIPDAAVSATIVHKLTRDVILTTLPLMIVDPATATFEGIAYKANINGPINNALYSLNLDITHGGVTTTVSSDLRAIQDNPHSPQLAISVPGVFTIGDDLPFRALYVRDVYGAKILSQINYEFLDRLTRDIIAAGAMTLYDPANGHHEAVIPRALLADTSPNNDYVLHVKVPSVVDTTVSAFLNATFDSISK